MPLFQKSIQKKYLSTLNPAELQMAWEKYTAHFHNAVIQRNILNAKEEEYQEGFVRDLFVNVLGYTLKPQPDFDLVLEKKSTSDSTKSDGAILSKTEAVIAVIELKDTNTSDLARVEKQAFGYKHQHKDCRYVITSNFQHLRFYINDATDFETFDLFRLSKDSFALMYCCLQESAIMDDVPLKMKQQSIAEEENITKKLYADYSRFRKQLFGNITTLNPQYNKLELFKKTQKLMDRFLFLLFAEDRLLLPPNSVRDILKSWDDLQRMDEYRPLYDRFGKFFGWLNKGHGQGANEIYPYNGGLFAQDEILDNIKVDDTLLYDSCKALSNYDFESDVDVNILGHIFEHSLSEIEKIEQELSADPNLAQEPEAKYNSKRKKDGVYYTPRYITKYIVENTVGALCAKKKEELRIDDEEYTSEKKKAEKERLLQKLDHYKEWLLQLTICDPACGSGAFLNQALEFLIREHNNIDQLKARLFGAAFHGSEVETSILEHNLYGVDINDEAVEIAKLSLWLRTAKKGRKLNDLSQHIRCGNSLIDDPAVAGEKAFSWEREFPEVFAKGGFDVVIGNPPYVFGGNDGISLNEKVYFKDKFQTGAGKVNLFALFIEKAFIILKQYGEFSFIIPNTFLRVTSYHESRKFFIRNFEFRELADLGADVFQDAVTTAIIVIASKRERVNNSFLKIIKDFSGAFELIAIEDLIDNNFIITSNVSSERGLIIKKMLYNSIFLGSECKEMIFGVVISKNKEEVVSMNFREGYKPFLEGKDITSYNIRSHKYLYYSPQLLHRARSPEVFEVPEKLLVQRITGGKRPLKVAYDDQGFYNKESINNIIINSNSVLKAKFILTLLNSKLINWFYNNQFTNNSNLTVNISKEYLSKIPIKIPATQQPFIEKANIMLSNIKELQFVKGHFVNLLKGKYSNIILNSTTEDWPALSFGNFLSELLKQKIKLSLPEQSEWMQYFESEKAKINAIQDLINKTDKEIDYMVYELYGLTEEEVNIVEGKKT